MKLDSFLRAKVQAGIGILEVDLFKLDDDDFDWLVGQFNRVETLIRAEMHERNERKQGGKKNG